MYLCFTSEWRHLADLLCTQSVDDGALANIGVSDETNADLFLIGIELQQRSSEQLQHPRFSSLEGPASTI